MDSSEKSESGKEYEETAQADGGHPAGQKNRGGDRWELCRSAGSTPIEISGLPGKFLKFCYTQNPFYLMSAGLVLYGLTLVFNVSEQSSDAWTLIAVLAGYTVLMACSAVFIVRFGQVWDDARSMLLLVLLLLLSLSVSFDEIIMGSPITGGLLMLTGLVFSLVLCWGLFSLLSIRLPDLYRLPFYGFLGLFFVYPFLIPVVEWAAGPSNTSAVSWVIYLFPGVAGILFLSLIPAIRRGSSYVRDNGTPWSWPWFPWTIFGVLALAVGLRSYMLGMSFFPFKMAGCPFMPFFLTPLVMALGLLVLEAGVCSDSTKLRVTGLVVPVVGMLLSVVGEPAGEMPVDLQTYMSVAGPPFLLAAVMACAYYAYAWIREVPGAEAGLYVVLVALSVTSGTTLNPLTMEAPRLTPLLGIAVIGFWQGIRYRSSWRILTAVTAFIMGITVALHGTGFNTGGGAVPIHLELAVVLSVGALFEDRVARFLQNAAAWFLPCFLCIALTAGYQMDFGAAVLAPYLLGHMALAAAYGWYVNDQRYLYTFLVNTSISGIWLSFVVCRAIYRAHSTEGTMVLILGAVFFLAAFIISCIKGNLIRRCLRYARSWDLLSEKTGG